jgi:hypothetical protein
MQPEQRNVYQSGLLCLCPSLWETFRAILSVICSKKLMLQLSVFTDHMHEMVSGWGGGVQRGVGDWWLYVELQNC